MGIASGLLVVAGAGGLALRPKPEVAVVAADCPGGQLAGQPRLAADPGGDLAQPTRSA